MWALGGARLQISSVIALLDDEIPQSAGGGSGDASGAEESDGGDCSASGSVGCSASPLVGEAVRGTVLGEDCPAAPSLVEQETIPKLSRAVAIMVNERGIVGSPLHINRVLIACPLLPPKVCIWQSVLPRKHIVPLAS